MRGQHVLLFVDRDVPVSAVEFPANILLHDDGMSLFALVVLHDFFFSTARKRIVLTDLGDTVSQVYNRLPANLGLLSQRPVVYLLHHFEVWLDYICHHDDHSSGTYRINANKKHKLYQYLSRLSWYTANR